MLLSLLILTAVLLCGVLAILAYSIVRPSKRIWPPPAQQTWQYYFVWLLTLLSFGGFIVVGLLDWNSLGWAAIVRWPIGVLLIVGGNVLAWVGVRQLSLKTTSGSKGPLVTDGLYRYSRNPQYLEDIAIVGGWAVLSASVWAISDDTGWRFCPSQDGDSLKRMSCPNDGNDGLRGEAQSGQ
ncbi:MAG: DUF1295 domain-containing protein [Planctomycetales bacterium]|nr:DUF1295 domain-containing protein [Planctomycetales bacterium]